MWMPYRWAGLPLAAACLIGCGAVADEDPSPTPDDRFVIVTATARAPEVRRDEPVEYVVQDGDTLLGIALEFGVSVEAIVIANNLDDPNDILSGQRLTIPPLPSATPTPLGR